MIDTVWRLQRVDLGVDRDNVLTFGIGLPVARYAEKPEINAFWDRFVEEIGAVDGIEAVALSSRQPLNGGSNGTLALGSQPDVEPTADMLVEIRSITPDYFRAVGMGLLRGRSLTIADRRADGGVLVNEAFVRRRLEGRDPLREKLRPTWLQHEWPIVGVISDTRDFGPTEDPRPTAYWMVGAEQLGMVNSYLYATVRTAGQPLAMLPAILQRLAAIDRDLPLLDVFTLDEIAEHTVGGDRRSALSLLSTFAAVALLLGAVGVYGVISYGVDTRAREIGVRMALGATRGRVVSLVLLQGARMALVGVSAGLVVSVLAGQLLASMLYGVTPTDPTILAIVALTLAAAAVLASWVPARRAARVSVVETLRND
jgi:putative ABC transport system permease protein